MWLQRRSHGGITPHSRQGKAARYDRRAERPLRACDRTHALPRPSTLRSTGFGNRFFRRGEGAAASFTALHGSIVSPPRRCSSVATSTVLRLTLLAMGIQKRCNPAPPAARADGLLVPEGRRGERAVKSHCTLAVPACAPAPTSSPRERRSAGTLEYRWPRDRVHTSITHRWPREWCGNHAGERAVRDRHCRRW